AGAKLLGGRPCLDFINTIGGRRERGKRGLESCVIRDDMLKEYPDLLAWGLHAGLLSDTEAQKLLRESQRNPETAKSVFKRATLLREAIYAISMAVLHAKQPRQTDLELLNQELSIAHSKLVLAAGKNGFLWQWNNQDIALD